MMMMMMIVAEIMEGNVVFADNPLLCYVSTIDWQLLLGGRLQAQVINANNPNKFQRTCKYGIQLLIASHTISSSSPSSSLNGRRSPSLVC